MEPYEREVWIEARGKILQGTLAAPPGARGVVVFAHGSGSGRHSPRNRYVASVLQSAGLATLLFDLLTIEEEEAERHTRQHRFDIHLLSERLLGAVEWLSAEPGTLRLPVGYFGASTGAAAALVAAAAAPERAFAVVSRGGRPDLAGDALATVRAPALLIVGGADPVVLDLNREAMAKLRSEKKLVVVPGATHLFQEPGALEQVARLAADWFVGHLPVEKTERAA
jgi:dienelactone hydrolase